MTPMDHDRCSEMLPAFLEGKLDDAEQRNVAAHLAECEQCRQERAGLASLLAGPSAALTADERARLESGVMSAIGEGHDATVVPLPQRVPFGPRAAGLLGAAAVIAVIATFVYFGFLGGGAGEDTGVGGLTHADTEERQAPAAEDADKGGDRGSKRTKDKARRGMLESAAGTSGDFTSDAPTPNFVISRDPYTSAELEKIGESSPPSLTFAHYYNASDADSGTGLDQLVTSAEQVAGSAVAEQVEECAGRVLGSERSILPTFGALGEVDGNDALIVGFAWTSRSRGPLDRYMVWAWQRGDCDVTLEYIEGRIETAN